MKKESFLVAALGLWLLVSPMSFGYVDASMQANDFISGLILIFLGFSALASRKMIFLKLSPLVGLWLQLAPLIFWAKDPSAYLNDTLVGMILMLLVLSSRCFSDEEKGEENPPNWSFNPSSLGPRRVIVFLALIAWFLSRYLASYQLGYIHTVEDPFFGDGTLKVISSSVAKFFPVSDAGLGAFGYSLEALLGLIGSSRRWKTMPWVTALFGLMVIPAGMISILLIVLQPVLVGAWCGICLLIALCMLIMVLLTLPEMAATVQLLLRARKNGEFWSVFFNGDRSSKSFFALKAVEKGFPSKYGFELPWNLLASICIGVWFMVSPYLFGDLHPASDANYVAGPLVIAISVISFSEFARSLRFTNLLISCGVVFSSFFLEGLSPLGFWSNLLASLALFTITFSKCERK